MMLRPQSVEEVRLDPDRLVRYDAALDYREGNGEAILSIAGRRMVSATGWWDPAYGAPGTGDASVVAAVFVDGDGGYWLHGIRYLSHDPALIGEVDEATQLCRQVARFAEQMHLPSITLETNGLGRFLPALLRRELHAWASPARWSSTSRTAARTSGSSTLSTPCLAAGMLRAHAGVWATRFIEEMREWRPGRRCRDDGLDAVSGCLLAEPVRLRRYAPGQTTGLAAGAQPASGGDRFPTLTSAAPEHAGGARLSC